MNTSKVSLQISDNIQQKPNWAKTGFLSSFSRQKEMLRNGLFPIFCDSDVVTFYECFVRMDLRSISLMNYWH
jgi:hypothetical protein